MKFFIYDETSLSYKDVTKTINGLMIKNIFLGVGITVIIGIFSFVYLYSPPIIPEPEIVMVCEQPTPQDLNFSEQALIDYMIKINIKYPHIVLAQSKIETGNFTSDIFKENHNLFGMREAKLRPKLALGTNRNHAHYSNWKESVLDYALWQCQNFDNHSESKYFDLLDKIYAEDPNYVSKLKSLIEKEQLEYLF